MPEGSNDDVQARWGLDNEKQVPWDKEKGLEAGEIGIKSAEVANLAKAIASSPA